MATSIDMASLLHADDLIIAANGGGRYCLESGCMPHILIGDFDSLSGTEVDQITNANTQVYRHPINKDATDLELAVDLAIQRKIRNILILAALGGRLDHALANLMLLGMPRFSAANIQLIDGDQEITLLRPGEPHVIQGSPGDIVSLIPIRGDEKTLTTSGLEYPLQRGHLPFGATLGVSNIMTASEATISLQEGLLICIVLNNITRRQK